MYKITSSESGVRFRELDVLRGFAALGIYWINVVVFALPFGAYSLPTLLGGNEQANIAVWAFSELFVEGGMRALFSLLFGASAMLLLSDERLAEKGASVIEHYYRRALILIVFGLVHAYVLLWPYDVLYAYGLFGLFLFPLRRLSPGLLVLAGCLLLAAGDIGIEAEPGFDKQELAQPAVPDLSDPLGDADWVAGLERRLKSARPEPVKPRSVAGEFSGGATRSASASIEESEDETDADTGLGAITDAEINISQEVQLYQSGYGTIFVAQLDDVIEQQSKQMYTTHVFDIGGMMLIGMALFKLGVLTGRCSGLFYLILMCGAYLLGGLMRGPDVHLNILHEFDLSDIDPQQWVPYNLSRLALALGHVGAVGLLCKYRPWGVAARWLEAAGRLALTNYVGQTLISLLLFYGFGFSLFAALNRYELVYVCLLVWGAQIAGSILWLKHFQLGPLEWLLRSLTEGRRRPMRRALGSVPSDVSLRPDGALGVEGVRRASCTQGGSGA